MPEILLSLDIQLCMDICKQKCIIRKYLDLQLIIVYWFHQSHLLSENDQIERRGCKISVDTTYVAVTGTHLFHRTQRVGGI